MSDLIIVGALGAAYGIKGWLKLRSLTQPGSAIFDYQPWQMRRTPQAPWQSLKLLDYRAQGQSYVVQLANCCDRTQAQAYRNFQIGIFSHQLPALAAGEYYWRDLIGLQVWTVQSEYLGVVDHLLETGANDVLVVRPSEGSLDQRERLIPFLRDTVIREIDTGAKKICVDWDADF